MEWQDGKRKLLQQLRAEIERRHAAEKSTQLVAFADQSYETFPVADLRDRDVTDVYGAMLGNWNFLQHYDASRPKVRLFNPDYEQHQWQSSHTVVAILCPDMAFAMDSVRGELNNRNLTIHTIHVVPLRVRRDREHKLLELLDADAGDVQDGVCAEMMIYLEINRHTDDALLHELEQVLTDILFEVALAVRDFHPMLTRLEEVAAAAADTANGKAREIDEIHDFLRWLGDSHFTFLGYEKLCVKWNGKTGPVVSLDREADLGLLRLRDSGAQQGLSRDLKECNAQELLDAQLAFSQSTVRSRVHRRVYPDYISVRLFDERGRVTEEHRFLGMYTASVYLNRPSEIPVIRRKVDTIFERAGIDRRSHEGSELTRILESWPRDELFQSDAEELFPILVGVLQIQERRQVRLFVRRDRHDRFVSCLVYVPRDLYNTRLRRSMESLLAETLGASESEFTTYFSESVLTRTYFVFRIEDGAPPAIDVAALEQELVRLSMSWADHLRNHLVEEFGEERGLSLADRYCDAFPPGYQDDISPRGAVNDIRKIESLGPDTPMTTSFFRHLDDGEDTLRFRLFQLDVSIPLSDVMPILENLGLRVLSERPYGLRSADAGKVWIHEFSLVYGLAREITVDEVSQVFKEAFSRIWNGDAENDSFNKLILGTRFGWRPVAMLRAYARYMKQIQFSFSAGYIADTLGRHLAITARLVRYFKLRFNPEIGAGDSEIEALHEEIVAALDDVSNLSEDRIIRRYLTLIDATVRTNYFQNDHDGELKSYFSFKFKPREIPDVPEPRPLYEIFVYSPRVEGVHLRGGKVARGGLRWSDREEDFRTEVLGLVKAQQVKNAVIVPAGAKGGFVARRLPGDGGREAIQAEGIACYRIFIQGLLDITDNLVNGEVVAPAEVLRKDEDDTYLVVAADKGTASFSDIANELALDYGFWLGDAFASGGSVGYDHKKMGITARGAWVSVQRHFRELGLNVQEQPFTVVGIGDMGGDVFGNGMLLSAQIRLVAAFNHMHIFIDPEPDAARSFDERRRLFELPRSSWEDYDAALISEGGGIFPRAAKSVPISAAMQQRFGISEDRLTPNELIVRLLKAQTDLLWNGGIGTYIKSSGESHADVGDKANDGVRINGSEVGARVVGEGGNLGVTQRGRVEYALAGGCINTDFIDNAAGVDCSDHEVNVKILLNSLTAAGDLTEKQRREILVSMTGDVAALVLDNNYLQTQALSMAQREAFLRLGEYRRLIAGLETSGRLDRKLEFIPDDEMLAERKTAEHGLTRPELSVLCSYVKGQLKECLVDAPVLDDPCVERAVEDAFPTLLLERFNKQVHQHRLRREIIATQVGNDLVNRMGITFCHRMTESTGAPLASVAAAYITARDILDAPRLWREIEALDYSIDAGLQMDLQARVARLVRRSARWFIRNRRRKLRPESELKLFAPALGKLRPRVPDMLRGGGAMQLTEHVNALLESGVPEAIARDVAQAEHIYPLIGIIDAAHETGHPVELLASLYFQLADELELDWFARKITDLKIENHWQALARESYRDDVEWQLRSLTVSALKYLDQSKGNGDDTARCIASWKERQQDMLARWHTMLADLHSASNHDFAMVSVAIRELLDLAQSSRFEAI